MGEGSGKFGGLRGVMAWSCLGMTVASGAADAAPTADGVEKAYGALMQATHNLTSDSDQFSPADAARFRAALDDAVTLYAHPADDKAAALGLTYVLAYCGRPPESVAAKCRELKKRGHALILKHYLDSNELLGFLLQSTAVDLPFVDELFDKTTPAHKSAIADVAGKLWLGRYNNEKATQRERDTAERMVLKYGHALEQDNAVIEWSGKSIAINHLRGEGLVNAVEVESKGKVLPDFGWTTFSGERVSLQQHRGRVVLLDFWATWCVPCVASMPHIDELRQELAGKPFEVISINAQAGNIKDIIAFQSKKVSMPWTNWRVRTESEDYFRIGIAGLPTYFVLDEKGRVLYRAEHFGDEAKERIRNAVTALSAG